MFLFFFLQAGECKYEVSPPHLNNIFLQPRSWAIVYLRQIVSVRTFRPDFSRFRPQNVGRPSLSREERMSKYGEKRMMAKAELCFCSNFPHSENTQEFLTGSSFFFLKVS